MLNHLIVSQPENVIVHFTASVCPRDKNMCSTCSYRIGKLLSATEVNSIPSCSASHPSALWQELKYLQPTGSCLALCRAQWSPSFIIHISKRHWGTLEAKLADPEWEWAEEIKNRIIWGKTSDKGRWKLNAAFRQPCLERSSLKSTGYVCHDRIWWNTACSWA